MDATGWYFQCRYGTINTMITVAKGTTVWEYI